MRALVSVYDKTGIVDFCKKLTELKIEIISTGGTGKLLSENGIQYIPVEEVTKNHEAFGGRMKTISFEMSSAILFRRDIDSDQEERKKLGITPIDLVVCNLYAFHSAVEKKSPLKDLIELIDVGGPTMIRAAAKNYSHVSVITDPADYDRCAIELMANNGGPLSLATNQQLAIKAFALTAAYDLSIHHELNLRLENKNSIAISSNVKELRYGENPHQKASLALFKNSKNTFGIASAPILQGKEISYNNYLDTDAAFKCVSELKIVLPQYTSIVIVKHGTPCGIASGPILKDVMLSAWEADNISAFGGIIAISEKVTRELAEFLNEKFIEVIIAPAFDQEALDLFSKKKNVRLIACPLKEKGACELTLRSISGGVLMQDEDEILATDLNFLTVTKETFPVSSELIYFGQTVIKYKKSNCLAIVGIENNNFVIKASGVGQPNRLECLTKLIAPKIKNQTIKNDILFSDAFFPFADSIESAGILGIKYIVQPGGSIKDKEVISACDSLGIAMKFSGSRHFRH